MKKILAIFVATIFAIVKGETEILLWAVSEDATINDGPSTLYSFLELQPYDGENYDVVYGAKVALKDSSGNFIRYIENRQYDDSWTTEDIDIGHPTEGYVGIDPGASGVGGVQSRMGDRELVREMYFQMQLGQSVWNYDTDQYDFTPLLYSDNRTGSYLMDENNFTYTQSGVGTYLGPDDYVSWMPMDFYTVSPAIPIDVPEPNSFILMTLGICLFGLKRKLPSSANF